MDFFTPNSFHLLLNEREGLNNSPVQPGIRQRLISRWLVSLFFIGATLALSSSWNSLHAQSSTCVPNNVQNGNGSPWSEECYLNNSCQLQGNPCQANDVKLINVYFADAMGNPVPPCNLGDMENALLWGTFNNSTGTSRYAIRTRTEVWLNGVFTTEFNNCSFDVLTSGQSAAALLGTINYTCGDQIQLLNTWIAWNTSLSQCSGMGSGGLASLCNDYSPSKCFKDLTFISLLSPSFTFACGGSTATSTTVCFTSTVTGGTPPYTYSWNFGDAGTSALQNPCHTYLATSGAFVATLTVTDSATPPNVSAVSDTVNLDSLMCCSLIVTCPPANGGTYQCLSQVPAANPALVIVVDSCGPVTKMVSETSTGTGCGTDTLRITRVYTISDGSMTTTCTQLFKVRDSVVPTITCATQTTPINCPATPTFTAPTATDNCDTSVSITFADATTPGSCPGTYTVTRTWTATDDCNNTATCSRSIVVQDNTPPTVTCVAQTTPINCPTTPTFNPPTVSDACDGTVTLTFSDSSTPGSCPGTYTATRTWTATDDCGNTGTCSASVVVVDNTPPEIVCTTQTTPLNCPATPTFNAPLVSDLCDASVALTFSDSTTPGSCPGSFSVTRTWTATDDCNNTATCSRTIVVQDNTPPTITCVAQTSPISCPATPAFNAPTATDACDASVAITFSDATTPGSCPGNFTVTRTWTATDDCNNTATCSSSIVVQDNTPPTITCVAQTSPINCPATPAFNAPTATDACDASVAITFSDATTPGSCPGNFTVTRTWTATDDCNNTATCSSSIVVQDNTPPTVTCVAQTTPINCPTAPTFNPPTVSDACDGTVTLTFSDASTPGSCPGTYTATRTWTATDDCGNTGTCSASVVVIDNIPPSITCTTQTTPLNCPATPTFNPPLVSDLCDASVAVTFSDATTPGSCPGTFSVTRTWTATDDCNNTATCSRTIVVQDNTPPTITCVAQTSPISCPATPAFNAPTVTDACDASVAITFSDVTTPGSCPGNFTVTRTWTATDDCNNTATCSSSIVVQDNTPPTITCVAQTSPINCPATPAFNAPTATDACDASVAITFSDATTPGSCPGTFTVTRTWTATDDCNNTATCSSSVVVQDNTPPTITCVAQTTPINCPATPVFNTPTATDGCDASVSITFSDATTPGSCPGTYSVTRTWTATDDCQNTATCSRTIVVQDNTPPTITCVAQTSPINCTTTPVFNPPTATDACDASVAITFSDVTTPGVCPIFYTVTRTWTATDDCGNTSTCSRSIVVQDNTPPAITCPNDVTINCQDSTLPGNTGTATATDVCDPTPTINIFDYFGTPPGTSPEMRWVFLPPGTVSGTCISGSNCSTGTICFGLEYTPGVTGTLTSYTTGFFLNCYNGGSPVVSNVSCVMSDNSEENQDCGGSGLILMNSSGNTGNVPITQNFPIYIHQICLQLGVGGSILLDEDEFTDLTTSVNLPGGGQVTEQPSFTNFTVNFDTYCGQTCLYPENIYRVFVASDDCGNQSTCVQHITVQDITPPTLTCATQTTPIDCPTAPVFVPPTVSDNCDASVTVTFADVTTPGSCPNTYSVTRTWTATDDCLNSSTCSRTIVVQDITPPTITCVAQTSPINCPATPTFNPPTASDTCDPSVTITFSDVSTPGSCPNTYSTTRTWTATDDCGNTATCSRTIVVQDNTPPTITCVAQTTPINCPATPVFNPPTASDTCDPSVTITFSDVSTPGSCPNTYSTTRTWTATDDCGNTATCSSTIVVQDNTPPTITCVAQTTPINCPTTPVFNPPTASDTCDPSVNLTFSDVSTPGSCPNTYSTTRTWTATDDCGNTATCSSTIVVQDITPPTITCVTQTTPVNCPATPVFTPPTATDTCDPNVSITFSDVSTPGSCPNTYSTTRTWTATDDCGNTATCSRTIVVQDITPPTITCVTQTTPVNCPATPVFTPPTATDTCDPSVSITFSDVSTPGSCPNTYSTTRTWTATDDCGNTATCSSTIVVQDITPPTITCVTQTSPINCPATPVFTPPTFSDACDLSVTLTFSDVSTPGSCPNTYSTTRTWTATDDCGNTATCSSTIVVQDNTPPTITCVAQTTPINCPATPVFNPPTASDTCDPSVSITFSDASTPGSCPNTYSTTRTWTATDDCGNTATCSRTITVQDVTPPTITCVTQTTPVNCPATPVFTPPTASDTCDPSVTITFSDVSTPGSCPNTYSTTRTWTATDDCGNTATCSGTIVVQDVTPPTITCVTQTTPVNCPATPVFTPPTATDTCDPSVSITFSDVSTPGSCPNTYSTTRTWTATDDCGNTASCSRTIVVQDITPPTITCVTQTTPVNCPATPVFTPPTATDTCDPSVSITFSDVSTPGSCPNTYSTTRTWTATDDCGNTATCSSTIVVQDITPPTITCVTQTTPVNCPALPVFTPPTFSDACDPSVTLTFSDVSTPGSCPNTYSTTRTWTATDDCQNTATCSRTIVVQDITPPAITCPMNITLECGTNSAPGGPAGTATATDLCDTAPTITSADVTTAGNCTQNYIIARTWYAADDCGNSSSCVQTITVADTQPPMVTCPPPVTVSCFSDIPPNNTGQVTATDNCSNIIAVVHVVDLIQDLGCLNRRQITRVYRATDECGNSATCTQSILVFDDIPPTLTCVTQTTPINCPATPVFAPPTATDNCAGSVTVTFSDVSTPGSCPNTYSTTRTWTATDICGNTATCSRTIVVQDITPPTITCVTQTTPVNCPAAPVFTPPTATDTCDPSVSITFSDVSTPGSCPNTYSTTRTWTATDDCGNTATCSRTIVVQDITPPTLTCVTQTTPINCPATPVFTPPTFSDACDLSVTLTFSDASTPGSCPNTYSTTRTWTATDDCGNTATCSSTIVVQDITPPTITCVTQTTPVNCPATPVFTPPTATDTCDPSVAITFSDVSTPGSCPNTYSTTRTWTATDDCGNTATCSRTIVVQDITPPTITCVTQTTPVNCPATPVFTPPTATDTCDPSVSITFSDVSTPGSCPNTYSTTRTWTATDDCGNTATCSGTIVVQDITPPTITCVTQTTPVNCPAAPVFTPPTATDTCDPSVAITFSDVSTPGSCPNTYSTTRTWTATDDCGNTATCSRTIVVQDITPPTITCVTQTTPVNCPALPVFTPPTATDTCDPSVSLTFSDVSTPGSCPNTYSTTRTWTATDDCGNTATCSSTIVVQDITPPTITCVTQTTPINCPATPVFTSPTATDTCDPSVSITFSDVSTPGSCPNTYSTTRTWTATDDCGNTATCSRTIVVQDITPPTITCVTQTTPIDCPATPVFVPPTATDTCDPSVSVTFSDVSTPGSCPNTYSTTRTWTATDDCGNTATCSRTIVVQDITPPTITCVTQTTPIDCPATPVFIPPTATDTCDPSVSITFSDASTPGSCPNTYSTTRTWTATDDCGNTATCSRTIVVQDITPPTITCVTQTTPVNCPATPVFTPPTATDTCDPSVSITFADVSTPGSCPNTYSTTRTWTATDDCGNTATCSRTIVVQDITPPTITCVTQTTPINCPATPVFTPPTATDTCDPSVSITFADVSTPGSCPNTYSTTRTWTATDDCGNTATCSRTIVVQDITPPTITCVTQTTPINCPATPVFTPPTASDTCDPSVTITFSDVSTPGSCPNTYSTTRTWTATDDCGNTATCSRTIVVQDITPPTITCATQMSPINCPATPVFVPPTATDTCDPSVSVTFSDVSTPGSCPGTYSTTRTWTATDDCGNTATCSGTIVVQDITPPAITCAPNITIECNTSTLPPATGNTTATDACDTQPMITFQDVTFQVELCPEEYTIFRTWHIVDDCGNSASCIQVISVMDQTPPTIVCPPNVTLECTQSTLPGNVQQGTTTYTDEMTFLAATGPLPMESFENNPVGIPQLVIPTPNFTLSLTPFFAQTGIYNTSSSGMFATDGVNYVAYQSDVNGTATFLFNNNINSFGVNITDWGDNGIGQLTFSNSAGDFFVVSVSPQPGGNQQFFGVVNSTMFFNQVVFTQTIPVEAYGIDEVYFGEAATSASATATDNCDPVPFVNYSDAITPGNCPQEYVITRTWTATDDCLNSSTCTQTLTVQDNLPPAFTVCPEPITIECDDSTDPQNTGFASATDLCDPEVTLTYSDVTVFTNEICTQNHNINRTWLASDDCGNTATCLQIITVVDITPPVITCPPNTTIECSASTAPGGQAGSATGTDNCDPTPTITSSDVITPSTVCIQEYTITRTWFIMDDCGNASSCVQLIFVDDSTPPTITCVTQATPVNCPATPVFAPPTATDACDPSVSITFSDASTPGSCPNTYSTTRTWTATDDCGNTATCSRTIVVQDITPPTITCVTQTTPVNCPALPVFTPPTASDTCDPSVTITFSDASTPGSCPNTYSTTRTWTATDDCGNTATCSSTIVVQDITPPTITCVTQTTPVNCPALPVFTPPTATDTCDPSVSITFSDASTPGSCPNTYSTTRTWTATDDCGNTATCSRTIVVQDITPPTITCVTQTTPVNCPALPVFTPPTASDTCDPSVTITFSDTSTPGSCPNTYSTTRTWTATDDCGNTATCSRTIVVQDITPPTITCVTQTTPVNCPALPVFTPPTATDTCDPSVSITFSDASTPGSCPNTYSTTRTWTATDDCGNTATCSRTIVVQDITPPTITCVTQTTPINCPATPVFTPPTASDTCDPSVTITFSDVSTPGSCPNTYSTTRTWTATDDCGNTATCSGTIVVQDITPPTITCVTQTTPINCPALPVFTPPTATDTCDPSVSITFSDASTPGSCPNTYSTTRTWTATDDCGNTATCSRTIVVQDITPPTITCVTQTTPINCPALPVFTPPTATDTCDPSVAITFSDVSTPGSCPNTYSTTRTWTATDDCGNTATCSRTIVVQDITPPTITCVTQTTPINCPATPVFTPPTASDTCDPSVTITFSDASTPGSCPNTYSTTRTWTATDDCGNTATCSRTIVVQDITPPTITCVTQTTPINCPATPVFTPPTATDTCDPSVAITFSDVSTPGSCPNTYSTTRTWTATDDCGNTATCSGTIVVQDITPPTITCVTQTTPINCPATPVFTPPTASDTCDPSVSITFSDASTPGSCPNTYTTTRTWTATDDCGNTATCSRTIVVQDITPPTITCVTQTTPINCPAVPVFTPPTATDTCDPSVAITFSDVSTPGSCPGTYSTTRTWTATDDCGNTATCSRTIVVQDITPPTITCATQVTPINCPAVPVFVPPTATDACDPSVSVTFTDLTTPGSCPQNYSVRRTWTATDDCGNTATCSSTIVVQDITPPVITCPPPVTVQCASQQPAPSITGVTASDACDPAPVVTFVSDVTVNQTCFNRYQVNRTYRATDACMNSATCVQVITVFDNTPPTITCPAPLTVQCASQVPAPNIGGVTTSDNCSGPAPVVTFVSDVTTNQTCFNRYTLNRTYRSTDACGNSATCVQIITVFDNTPPTLTCPANLTVQCANQVPVPNPASVTTSDNCSGPAPVVTFVSDVTTNQTCINRYTLTRTYRSTDACGNSATCTQVITVFDNTPPVITPTNPLITNIPNNGTLEIQCFGQDPEWDLPTFGPGDVSASDNCTGTVVVTFDDVLIDEGNCPVDGYINRYRLRWTATDACGNSSSYTVFLNLIDTIPPVILGVPEDITVNCDEVPEAPTLTAVDECLCACVVELEQDGPHPGCQDGQIITRTWEATDYCGNVTIEQQHITLVDHEGPVLTIEEPNELAGLPDGTLLEFTCNEGGIPDYFDDLSAESVSSPYTCGGLPTITFNENEIISRNCKRFGYIQERSFTWTGVDACGNVTTLTITAHLIDDEAPVIVGVPDMACEDDPALNEIEAIDNCDKAGLIFWDNPIENPCGSGQAYLRTYEAVDPCGNYARDSVIIIPNDNIPPTIVFTNPDLLGLGQGEYISVECEVNGDYYTPWGPQDVSVEDDCPGVTLDFEQTTMQVYSQCEDGALLWLQLTWTATDLCGNSSSLFLYVYVKDETPPVFAPYAAETTIGCNDTWPLITATDNCSAVTITEQDQTIPTDCEYEYDVIRHITAVDLCGNVATAAQILHVGDHSGPDITGVDTLLCNDLSIPNVTAWDPCAERFVPVTMTQDTLDINCPGLVIERTWTATDVCGNVAEVTQRIILNDTEPPVIEVPTWSIIRKFMDNDHNFVRLSEEDIMKQLNELDESSVFVHDLCDVWIIPVFTLEVTYSDNCVADGWYEHRVYTWVATDECGNSTVLTFAVDILDDVAPVFLDIPADITVICGQLTPASPVHASDYAEPITITYEETIGDGDAPGHYIVIRTWTATDPCGNVTVQSQHILWIPDTFVECEIVLPDVVDCNTHGVVIGSIVTGGIGPFTYVWDVIGQECFIQDGQGTSEITIYVGFFDVTISLTVTDAFGCQSVCTATLECFDPLDQFNGNNQNVDPQTTIPNSPNSVQLSKQDYLQQLNYWPNPANTIFNVSFDARVERDVEISFMNFLGEVVLTDHMKAHVGKNTRKIDVTKLPEGTYLFQVMTDKEVHAKGVVIMR